MSSVMGLTSSMKRYNDRFYDMILPELAWHAGLIPCDNNVNVVVHVHAHELST